MPTAADLIAALGLAPHPEGGWYRETVREPSPDGGRDRVTAIYFLLDAGQRSHWHRVDAAEIWLWHAGAPLTLRIDADEHRLGPDVLGGEAPQMLVPPHAWQSAEADSGWTLVSCIVAPGFDFAGFELAPEGWTPDLPTREPRS
ncbi:cupin domain-containing protein [Sphingomonas sp. DT-204]|uniref:cupin domain-containing protein n=1 Tax=Sphingomonas sp. DT-204 TaxID=3396166 RepID=UPI003F1DB41E